MRALAAILPRRDGEVTLTHQWLPDLVRLAIAAGDERTARTAAELPAALKDLAAVLARHGRQDEATHALNEAASLYDNLDARWDIQRAQTRPRPYGIKRTTRAPRRTRTGSTHPDRDQDRLPDR